MRKFYPCISFILLSALLILNKAVAQSLPVGAPVIEDAYRREQLLGKIDSHISFTIRPLSSSALNTQNIFDPDNSLTTNGVLKDRGIYKTADGKGIFEVLPVSWQQQYNTHNPYGWNDGSMIPAAGYQSLFSLGVYARYKFLSIQLQPEFVYAQNKNFDGFAQANNEETVWKTWYALYNHIDLPERFGTTPYSKLLPGQSSIRINFDPVSLGLSTENLWWGPGVRSSLVMSNTATGFAHITLNTTRPVKTIVGSFEAQLIGGKLVGSGYNPLPAGAENQTNLNEPKPNDWRYLSGLVVTYHPKWVPGLFLGLTRVLQQYHTDVSHNLKGYLPVFDAYTSSSSYDASTQTDVVDKIKQDQLSSIFARYILAESHAEVYFEYGKNDHNWDFRDLLLDPEHSRAYIVGLKKLFKLSNPDEHIQVSLEETQLAQPANDAVERNAGYWYTHSKIVQGYTNNGELLGAGIGPGGSLQSVDISWFKGLKKIGLQIERYEHNMDFYYKAFTPGELRRHWVDYSAALSTDFTYNHFILSPRIIYIDQLNYQWKFKQNPTSFYWTQKYDDVNNFHIGLNMTYRF